MLNGTDPHTLTIEGKDSYNLKCEVRSDDYEYWYPPEFKRTYDYDSYKIV